MILLAIAGFAAFNADAPSTSDTPVTAVPWGKTAGAVSAQGWLSLAGARSALAVVAPSEDTTPPPPPRGTQVDSTAMNTGWLDSLQVRGLVETYFGSGDVNRAVRLAWCVSRFDVDAHNPTSGAVGLFQIDPDAWVLATAEMGIPSPDPFDPETNVAVAAHIVYHQEGWAAWDCE